MLTATEFDYFNSKYKNLIYKISHKISGDNATASIEDNVQDLWIALIEAVKGFEKQGNGQNGSLKDFIHTKGFDKYLKTCLWTTKNSKGRNITKKKRLYTCTVDVFEYGEVLGLEAVDTSSPEFSIFMEQISPQLSDVEKNILHEVVSDPSLMKPNGKVNVKRLSELLKKPMHQVHNIIEGMSEKLKNEF